MHKPNIFDLFNEQNPAPDPAAAVPDNVVTAAQAKTDPIPAEPEKQPEVAAPAAEPAEQQTNIVESEVETDGVE